MKAEPVRTIIKKKKERDAKIKIKTQRKIGK